MKQRDKLTRDMAYLIRRQDKFVKLLGPVKIKRYMFLVPFFDSHELVQHASDKTIEYREMNLPHLHSDFHVVVIDEDAYGDVREELVSRPKPIVEIQDYTPEEVAAWISANGDAVSIAEIKLRRIIAEQPRRLQTIEGLTMQYIKGENALEQMRQKYPDNWERATRARNHKEQLLIFEYPVADIRFNSLAVIAKALENELGNEVPALDSQTRSAIAWAAITDWIMRCPLDFPSVAS